MKEALIAFIQHYGYVAVFISMMLGVIGIPIPIEFLLLFAGSIVVAAKLQIIWLVVTAWLGAMAGMCVNYSLGRTIGISSISKITKYIHLPEERLNEWSLRFQRSGPAFITLGYFVAGLRHASPFIAGASGMTFRRFAVYAGAGGFLWILLFALFGRNLGHHWHSVMKWLHHPTVVIVIILLIVLAVLLKKRIFSSIAHALDPK